MKTKRKKKAAAKKTCDHKWEWLDCGEAVVCRKCDCYSQDINDAPFGESKLLYMELARHRAEVSKLEKTSRFRFQVALTGWAFAACLVVIILVAKAEGWL